MDGLTSRRVICSVGNNTIYSPLRTERGWGWGFTVGTYALVCPPFHPLLASREATSPPLEGLGEAFIGDDYTDRRGRLSLLCGIHLDRKNHSNRLSLGAPPLEGGWEGFPDEDVCPYFEQALQSTKGTYCNSKIIIHNSKLWLVLFEIRVCWNARVL